MRSRGLLVVSVAILLATAGCSGLGGETNGPTLTPAPVPERGTPEQVVTSFVPTESAATFTPENPPTTGPLGLRDQRSVSTALWRLRTLLDVKADEPTVVHQLDLSVPDDTKPLALPDAVIESLGPATGDSGAPPGWIDTDNETIHLLGWTFGPARLEYNLAYLHAQYLQDHLGWTDAISTHEHGTLDRRLVAFALRRGGAAFVADAYAEQYGLSVDRPAREWQFGWLESPWLARAAIAAGEAYARDTASSPSELRRIYAEPPNTTEQLLYGLPPGSEPPRPLQVTVVEAGEWKRVATARFGELGIRALLSTRLETDVAERGGSGWGNDRLLAFEDAGVSGVVWVTTWDQPTYADQFVAAFEQYAAAGDPPRSIALTRIDDRTVVAVAGPTSFVESVTVTGTNASVSISLAG